MAIILVVGGIIGIFKIDYGLIVLINLFVFGYGLSNGPVSNNYKKIFFSFLSLKLI